MRSSIKKTAMCVSSVTMCHALGLLSMGCADITPIEDGIQYGPVTVIQDWFTSFALIRSGDEAVVIDAGFGPEPLKKGLKTTV